VARRFSPDWSLFSSINDPAALKKFLDKVSLDGR
jgi:hypothetical protein